MNLQAESYADNTLHAVFGFLITIILSIVGLLSFHISKVDISLIWLPLMGVYLWPRFAAPIISVVLIFIAGLLHDILNAQSLGFTSILFLLVYIFLRPRLSFENSGRSSLWLRFGAVIGLTIFLILLFKLLGSNISISNFPMQILVTLLLFPVFLGVRNMLSHIFIPTDRL